MQNPFSIMFGKEPPRMISRISQSDQVIRVFTQEEAASQIFMITGVRGAGKTVFMTSIEKKLKDDSTWVTIELNPAVDLIRDLVSKLYNDKSITELFIRAKINLSFFGIGVGIENMEPITDMETAAIRMLESLKRHHKKLLITIDEVSNTQEMKVFASVFQIFVRKDLPVFLLMTGLQENIDALQNNDILTFLHRAPKIQLSALDMGSVAESYREVFHLEREQARHMAQITKGYPYAFQVLGYYTFEKNGDFEAAVPKCKQYLNEYVYDKIWSELSRNDRQLLYHLTQCKDGRVSKLRERMEINPNELSPYRSRLIKKGLLNGEERGYLRFVLPFFEDYVIDNTWEI